MGLVLTRRRFTVAAAATFAATRLPAQSAMASVATLDREVILAQAADARSAKPTAPIDLSAAMAALTAAFLVTRDEGYALATLPLLTTALKTVMATPVSQRNPAPNLLTLLPYAEMARATSFLGDMAALAEVLAAANLFFTDLLAALNETHEYVIARDTKDHRASAWLLLTAALARSQRDDKTLALAAHRFKSPTLRNQLDEVGRFPQELATANPYRNSLFNFDLLAGACQLLSSPFDDLFRYELADGPGLRSAAAFLYPVIADPAQWPAVADQSHFHDLPGRRPGLLFCGRAYRRPEYVSLWLSTPPTIAPALADTFPIRQPLLWVTRAPHGL